MVSLGQTIMLISEYTVGLEGDISLTQLSQLRELVADEVAHNDPGFSPTQRILFEAYYILDLWECRPPDAGGVVSETVLDTKWTVNLQTSSIWKDNALRMRDDFRAQTQFNRVPHGACRHDHHMDNLRFDNTVLSRYRGHPP